MKTVGIITEYNPFHKGHKYHIEETKRATGAENVVAVMSGNYVQRGEPAIINKWARTEMALKNGCDLVLELPSVVATAGAETFAFGAVHALNSTGVVDYICFGSESGNIQDLKQIADILSNEPPRYKTLLKQHLDRGFSYPKAREVAISEYLAKGLDSSKTESPLSSSNNILGIEYLKALNRLNSNIEPVTIKRQGAGYNDTTPEQNQVYPSATYIRQLIEQHYNGSKDYDKLSNELKPLMPPTSVEILLREISLGRIVTLNKFNDLLMGLLRMSTIETLAQLPDISEGLENRILKAASYSSNLNDFFEQCKTSRYPLSRIKRIVLSLLTGVTKKDVANFQQSGVPYVKILGLNSKGAVLSKRISAASILPLVTKPGHLKKFQNPNNLANYNKNISRAAYIEAHSTDIYTLAYNKPELSGYEYRKNPIIQTK